MAKIWDKIFKKPEKTEPYKMQDFLSGIVPRYSKGFGDNIYMSDVVQQCIYSIVTEIKKVDPVHIRKIATGSDYVAVEGNIQSVLDAPNPLMTSTEFIEKIIWNLLLNYNAFVYPIWSGDTLIALYPLQPSAVDFYYDDKNNLWTRFTFPNGYKGDVPYDNLIHIKHKYSLSEFMGGNQYGQPDFKPLLETLKINDSLLKGLAKSLNYQTTINGIIKTRTMANADAQISMIKEFEKKLQANESGLLPIDISNDYVPISKQVALLDATTLEFVDKKILRFFGVSAPILDGNFTPEQYAAFYQKTLEPIIKSLGQAFTKGLFTKRASFGFNNKIAFYVRELIFMNNNEKLQYFTNAINIGACYANEYRTAFGMRPLNELQGVRMQSLNYVNSDYAKEYQTGAETTQGTQGAPTDNQNSGGGESEPVKEQPTQEAASEKHTLLVGQIQALLEIVAQFQTGLLGYEQSLNMIIITIGLSKEEAEKMLDKNNIKDENADGADGMNGGNANNE